jgi:hypothetical protein
MNGKQTALMAVVGMALLATVMTVSSLAPALALSHLNLDGDFTSNNAEEDSSHIAYEELLVCLLNVEEETEQEVQDCFESSYGGMDSSENANDSEDEDDDDDEDEDEDDDDDDDEEDVEEDENSEK